MISQQHRMQPRLLRKWRGGGRWGCTRARALKGGSEGGIGGNEPEVPRMRGKPAEARGLVAEG